MTAAVQDALFARPRRVDAPVPELAGYDVILINISGGKDSQATLDVTVAAAEAAGVRDRIVAVFADLGDEDEWPGTRELAAEHAAHYQVRHEVVWRTVPGPDGEPVQQSLSEHIEQRGMWPDAARRYCTSDMKRGPVRKLMTRLAAEQRAAGVAGRQVRILNVMGLRAQESRSRAKMAPFRFDEDASNQSVRHVDEWLPILAWHVTEVWARIARAGTRPHPVYAQGMPRLSCQFCVLASRSALIRAAQINPSGAADRAAREARMDHSFRQDLSMADIIAAAEAAPGPVVPEDWAA
jgi:3'-phosphoadenosine 5'-phosphosulfate sulfotransferase (PAPS reductase)/FAD synthetase